MEGLVQMLALREILRAMDESGDGSVIGKDLYLVYIASKVRLFEVADRIAKGPFSAGRLANEAKQVQIPVQDEWNFRLGDRVKVKYPLEEFKYIQGETLGWGSKLPHVVGSSGFVSDMYSRYDNTVKVFFPASRSLTALYAGVLEKMNGHEEVSSRWKVGDYVRTRTDRKVVALLQRGHADIPDQFIGRKARVIAVTKAGIFLTFNERTSYIVNSALLLPSDDKSIIRVAFPASPLGFQVGDKVNVLPNLKKLIQNQKGKGGWNPSMCELKGKQAIITDVNGNGTVDVKVGHSKSWALNAQSLSKVADMSQNHEADVDFKPDDIVMMKIPENAGAILGKKDIPGIFLEYLKCAAVVHVVDDDFDAVVQFNCNQRIGIDSSSLRRANLMEARNHANIQKKVKSLKRGDRVYLDVGPQKLATHILTEDNTEAFVIQALTKPSTLLGYSDLAHAVIQYDDGRKFRINKKYLTIPEKFSIVDPKNAAMGRTLDVKMVQEIQTKLQNSKIGVALLGINLQENPPTVKFQLKSGKEPTTDTIQRLREQTGWVIQYLGNGVFSGKM